MSDDAPVLEVRDLHVDYPLPGGWFSRKRALHAVTGVDLVVPPARTVGIVGESGCGKSTLARAIVGLLRPTRGQVVVCGVDLATASRATMRRLRPMVQMVFQDPYASLNPWMSVHELISEPWRIHRGIVEPSDWDREVDRLLELVGLRPNQRHLRPHQFSGGQRQRISLARALAMRPKLIVCDEVVSALDVSIRAQILNLLRDIQQETGVSYLFVSHDLGVVRHVADEVAVMYLGRIVEHGATEHVFAEPAHPYTQALLSAAPILDLDRGEAGEEIVLSGEVPSPLNPPSGCPFRTRCGKARDLCAIEVPRLADRAVGHDVACHFAAADARFGIVG
ncbi:ABC transporter ATP-binding protein [Thermasporomyces composti]|jgi:oligopeptide transport system ATP-binding protein|uniref:Peptide/nickel transport system ATP-binding protein/oligopeptide transport system ATP-binding protein n=1 Tax=Thermasporomyces composti TaxID=696763 RepID=A0A3D9V1U1_THECX|nr:oligopeptide/dipeptide ABC transporter ATP-binding protein [Thermasporomyces composti]REF34753.1 peptide/nickel transport system ATP-binding protein/oligopeptide transport system ATP-binding protein [Thermasporomyces composti]